MSEQNATEYQNEINTWNDLFADTTPATQKAVSGLIQKAARLHFMCCELEKALEASGVIKIHPSHPELQKQIPAVKEYARLAESYANITNKLNALRIKNTVEDDDELGEFE